MPSESASQTANRGEKGEELVRDLRNAITSGRYVPGQRLVEADLTAELGVSRSLLREALQRLSAEGLVEIVPNRGAIVKRLSFVETVELFQIRLELEALAARLAAANMGEKKSRHSFEAAISAIWSNESRLSTAAYLNENETFHAAIFSASGNEQLAVLNRRLRLSLLMAQIAPAITVDMMNRSLSEHRTIAGAILDRDSAAADAAARAHLNRAKTFMETIPANLFRSGNTPASR